MATIATENRKHLRQAMRVECGIQETSDEPTSITPSGDVQDLESLANLDRSLVTTVIMDLGGDGFLNNGEAVPMQTDTDSYRYGYISDDATLGDGTFATPFEVTISAADDWDIVTLEVMGQYGDKKVVQVEPVWSGGSAVISLDSWTPGERAYIVGVYLGMAWIWSNDNLLGVNLDLRAVNTEIGGELEVSSIEIRAYDKTDYTDVIGMIPIGSPIWYTAGYDGDMSELRSFYLSETITWNDNVLTVKGQDASMLLNGVELPVDCDNYAAGWLLDNVIGDRIRDALATITYTEVGTPPAKYLDGPQVVLYDAKSARSIISEYTGVFRRESEFRVTYVDAGRPTLTFGEVGSSWTIYADEISDLNILVEQNKHRLEMVLPEYYMQYNAEIDKIETTSGKIYFVELDPPVPYNNISISPTPTSSEEVNCSLFKFKAAASTTYTLSGYPVLENLTDSNNPYSTTETDPGDTYKFDFGLPLFNSGYVSITKRALMEIIKRSNILYEFTYRGNPHIQPRDVLNVEIATWKDVLETSDGLLPDPDLYPAPDLYPNGVYQVTRKIFTEWVTMTVDNVTLEHSEGGGLTSRIRARKGAV